MSAYSCCVTCGMFSHATLRCSAVLRRTARIGLPLDLAPLREVGQRFGRDRAAHRSGRRRRDHPLRVLLHIVDRDASARPAARHLVDVHAQLARHAADRRCCRRRRLIGRTRLGNLTRAAVDVDHLCAGPLRGCGSGILCDARLVRVILPATLDVLFEPASPVPEPPARCSRRPPARATRQARRRGRGRRGCYRSGCGGLSGGAGVDAQNRPDRPSPSRRP